jgi:hypothetical protein
MEHTGSEGYERRDVSFRPIVLAGVGIAALVAIVSIAMAGLLVVYRTREAHRSAPPSPLAAYAPQEPPAPRLQVDPLRDLKMLHASEDALLHDFGWVDRQAGIVRIPIERAMELLVVRRRSER